jgi:hypothetical protein
MPSPWKTKNKGKKKGHDPKAVAVGCILKTGLNKTYDGIEAHMKDSRNHQTTLQKNPWS